MQNDTLESGNSIERLLYETDVIRLAYYQGQGNVPLDAQRKMSHSLGCAIRRVLVNSARHIEGGYSLGTPEDNAVEMLLRIAQEIPL